MQCVGGASGDMLIGAIVNAGIPVCELNEALSRLKVQGVSLLSQSGQRGGVKGSRVSVVLDERARKPRRWQEMVAIAEKSSLSRKVVERAVAVFRRLAKAEATVHGISLEQVHLHELGSFDTLVDVVGSIAGLELLGIERLYSSAFPCGSGVVQAKHGVLPVPAPATAALFAMARAPVVAAPGNSGDTGEMVTPTGAAIITTLATFRQPPLTVEKIGYGLGCRESTDYPNMLALWIGEEPSIAHTTNLTMLETNIDDMSGEMLAYVQERLFELGARDVWFTPIQMKKGRPATMLSALVTEDMESQAVTLVMRESSSLGVRVRPAPRYEADRKIVDVITSLGSASVKVKSIDGEDVSISPEYESCRKIALKQGIPLQDVFRLVQAEATKKILKS